MDICNKNYKFISYRENKCYKFQQLISSGIFFELYWDIVKIYKNIGWTSVKLWYFNKKSDGKSICELWGFTFHSHGLQHIIFIKNKQFFVWTNERRFIDRGNLPWRIKYNRNRNFSSMWQLILKKRWKRIVKKMTYFCSFKHIIFKHIINRRKFYHFYSFFLEHILILIGQFLCGSPDNSLNIGDCVHTHSFNWWII